MLLIMVVVTVVFMVILLERGFRRRKMNKEYDQMIRDMPSMWEGWIELADTHFSPLMFGKVLYSFDRKVVGVGVLMKENLPPNLVLDIDEKIGPQLLDGYGPLCRFLIDCQGRDVVITELKDRELKEKLNPYVADYSKIKLKMGLDSNEFVLVDNKEGEKDFERIWQSFPV